MSWAKRLVSKAPPPPTEDDYAPFVERARQMWDEHVGRPYCPAWEQLGGVTQGVWIKRAYKEANADASRV